MIELLASFTQISPGGGHHHHSHVVHLHQQQFDCNDSWLYRPGDSWADITFNVIMSQILRVTQAAGFLFQMAMFREHNPLAPEVTQTMLPLFQVTWADDLAVMLQALRASLLPVQTATALLTS